MTEKIYWDNYVDFRDSMLTWEDVYQQFKERLINELAVDVPHETHYGRLMDKPNA